jgi:hypothetical protein
MFPFITIIFGSLVRLFPHIPNFAPITATALFGGSHLKKRYAIIIPLVMIALSDYLLLYINPYRYPFFDFSKIHSVSSMFHSTTLFVWGSFLISGIIGLTLRKNKNKSSVVCASLICSLQFFLITNFGVWATGMYSRGIDGLLQSYIMGLPFLKWTILGDLFYTGAFFGVYEFGKSFSNKFAAEYK